MTVLHFRKKKIEVFTFLKKNQKCTLESRIIVPPYVYSIKYVIKMITKLFGRIYVINFFFFFCCFNEIIRVKIKKIVKKSVVFSLTYKY